MATLSAAAALGAVLTSGCGSKKPSSLEIVLTTADPLPGVTTIEGTVTSRGRTARAMLRSPSGGLGWPATLTIDVGNLGAGTAALTVVALDDFSAIVAVGNTTFTLPRETSLSVTMRCQSIGCSSQPDGGSIPDGGGADLGPIADRPDERPPQDGGSPDTGTVPACGNGRIDRGETCDIALAPELPGACPGDCDDGIACTRDNREGMACTARCRHVEITTTAAGDGCCPAHADRGLDADCSANCGNQRVDPGESCDVGIAAGTAGACPTGAACEDRDLCTTDLLISAGTCSARCVHALISVAAPDDGCCPVGADNTTDADCRAACGNGVLEPGERCDVGIASGPGACPRTGGCSDNNPCTIDVVGGQGCDTACEHRPVLTPAGGDGCCPPGGFNHNVDPDCRPACGNKIVEWPAETCEPGVPGVDPAVACDTFCESQPRPGACWVLQSTVVGECVGVCVPTAISDCRSGDGCCPQGCNHLVDNDCSASCGNGSVETGESCDTAIPSGSPGACPTSCSAPAACNASIVPMSFGTCHAACVSVVRPLVIAVGVRQDMCCPPDRPTGDPDCPAVCGNGVVETGEICDPATTPPSCPTSCPPPEACANWTRIATSECNVQCVRSIVTACVAGDGCCPTNCVAKGDPDCAPRCGDGRVDPGETCDRGITAGNSGACPASCADDDPCTLDLPSGTVEGCSRACAHLPITACGGGDRCCPKGCGTDNDADCSATCGDGKVQAGESCDPASACPTSCSDDGDPCTSDRLAGAPATCDARCVHQPIVRCLTTERDRCCPTGCTATTDSDC
jgi:hypothetical protein